MLLAKVLLVSTLALEPPPPPSNHVIRSKNGLFSVAVNARKNISTIKQVRRGWFDKVLWTVPEYFEDVEISDDGTYVFTYSDGGAVDHCQQNTEVVRVWRSDGGTRSFFVGDLVSNMARLGRYQVMGFWMADWGRVEGTQREWLKIKSCEGRLLLANVKTGEVRSGISRQRKP